MDNTQAKELLSILEKFDDKKEEDLKAISGKIPYKLWAQVSMISTYESLDGEKKLRKEDIYLAGIQMYVDEYKKKLEDQTKTTSE